MADGSFTCDYRNMYVYFDSPRNSKLQRTSSFPIFGHHCDCFALASPVSNTSFFGVLDTVSVSYRHVAAYIVVTDYLRCQFLLAAAAYSSITFSNNGKDFRTTEYLFCRFLRPASGTTFRQ